MSDGYAALVNPERTKALAESAAGRRDSGVACPKCGVRRSRVVNSRPGADRHRHWRRRVCANGHRYSTEERAIECEWNDRGVEQAIVLLATARLGIEEALKRLRMDFPVHAVGAGAGGGKAGNDADRD